MSSDHELANDGSPPSRDAPGADRNLHMDSRLCELGSHWLQSLERDDSEFQEGFAERVRSLLVESGGIAAMTRELSPGMRVGNHTIRGTIGVGGMGRVYRAERDQIESDLALKVSIIDSDSASKRFGREAFALARLRHRGIPALHFFGELEVAEATGESVGRVTVLAMEYIPGAQRLSDWLRSAPHSLEQRLRDFIEICDIVAQAHERGIVHRDLSPKNILIDEQGDVYVIDFGLAYVSVGEKLGVTQGDEVVGTPGYLSPEQSRGAIHAREPTVDVFALGAILYELVCLRRAFPEQTLGDAREALDRYRIALRLPVDRLGETPAWGARSRMRDLAAIVGKASEPQPQHRYADARALQADVQRLVRGERVLAQRLTIGYRVWCWLRSLTRADFKTMAIVGLVTLCTAVALRYLPLVRAGATALDVERYAVDREVGVWNLLWTSPALGRSMLETAKQSWPAAPDAEINLVLADVVCLDYDSALRRIERLQKGASSGAEVLRQIVLGVRAEGSRYRLPRLDPSRFDRSIELFTIGFFLMMGVDEADEQRLLASEDFLYAATCASREAVFLYDAALAIAVAQRRTSQRVDYAVDLLRRRWSDRMETPYFLGLIAYGRGDFPSAKRGFLDALSRGFDHPRLRVNLALVLAYLGEFDRAVTEIDASEFDLDPRIGTNPAFSAINRGVIYQLRSQSSQDDGSGMNRKRDLELAKEQFRKATEIEPRSAIAWRNLGVTLGQLGDLTGAERALRNALRVQPGFGAARHDLGETLRGLAMLSVKDGDFESAEVALLDALHWSANGRTWYRLAQVREVLDDPEGASEAYFGACVTATIEPGARDDLRRLLIEIGR